MSWKDVLKEDDIDVLNEEQFNRMPFASAKEFYASLTEEERIQEKKDHRFINDLLEDSYDASFSVTIRNQLNKKIVKLKKEYRAKYGQPWI
tara:strand:- start:275 stop:547 length:273 start_codon:yes stop_codon:yes gene_type:complete